MLFRLYERPSFTLYLYGLELLRKMYYPEIGTSSLVSSISISTIPQAISDPGSIDAKSLRVAELSS
jgi:hypothetical protein